MKLVAFSLLTLLTCAECAAAQEISSPASPDAVSASSLPDSVRQAVHQLFKRGRLYSTIGGLSGLLVASSGVTYVVRDGVGWSSGIDIVLGGSAVAASAMGKARYSRRQERKVLSALEQGYPLPTYVAELVPLLPKRNRQMILSSLYK
ncbi:hypothetical protein FNT36_14340 [Hymenobacter setariae]|uniref:Uncharacterized protein n=1 Tax=Hymenobacter setariae TaxID=2594794 RepID=A0A558BVV4_9BACT|nr:hypothetical protein FNT36_14340 [Hymenobacter setariae]